MNCVSASGLNLDVLNCRLEDYCLAGDSLTMNKQILWPSPLRFNPHGPVNHLDGKMPSKKAVETLKKQHDVYLRTEVISTVVPLAVAHSCPMRVGF